MVLRREASGIGRQRLCGVLAMSRYLCPFNGSRVSIAGIATREDDGVAPKNNRGRSFAPGRQSDRTFVWSLGTLLALLASERAQHDEADSQQAQGARLRNLDDACIHVGFMIDAQGVTCSGSQDWCRGAEEARTRRRSPESRDSSGTGR